MRTSTYEPNYPGSSVIAGPRDAVCSAHGSHSFIARPGHHLPPQALSGGRNLAAELGTGFILLAFGADDASVQSIEDAANSLNLPLKIIKDSIEDGREKYEAKLILVRPDQYIVWSGDTAPDDPPALIMKVTGRAS